MGFRKSKIFPFCLYIIGYLYGCQAGHGNNPGANGTSAGNQLRRTCFFILDLFLEIWDYYQDRFLFLALNRVIYFTGQLLFASALVLAL